MQHAWFNGHPVQMMSAVTFAIVQQRTQNTTDATPHVKEICQRNGIW